MGEAKRRRQYFLGDTDHYVPRAGFCPYCGSEVDCANGLSTDDKPSEGDVSICLHCANVNRFGPGMTVVPFPEWRTDPTVPCEVVAVARMAAIRAATSLGGKRGRSKTPQ